MLITLLVVRVQARGVNVELTADIPTGDLQSALADPEGPSKRV
jgi:hypothetical protein